jgi:hypothetical protein
MELTKGSVVTQLRTSHQITADAVTANFHTICTHTILAALQYLLGSKPKVCPDDDI